MVTRILLDPRRDLPTGLTGSSTITVEATPTGVREDGSVVVLPTKLSFTVNTAADIVQLAPPAASWAWRIVSRDAVSNVILQQRTVRFADVPSIAYADLTDVDPSSLKQTPSTSRQWDATFYQLAALIAALQPVGLSPAVEAEIVAQANAAVAPILAGSNASLDSFLEVATKFGLDEATVSALQALVAGKANTADLANYLAVPSGTRTTGFVPVAQPNGTLVWGDISAKPIVPAGTWLKTASAGTYVVQQTRVRYQGQYWLRTVTHAAIETTFDRSKWLLLGEVGGVAALDAVPAYCFGDSYSNNSGGAAGPIMAAFPYRVAAKNRTLALANFGAPGTRSDQILAAVQTNWTPGSKGLVILSDIVLNDTGSTGYADTAGTPATAAAFQAMLAYLTSQAIVPTSSGSFLFAGGWSAGASSTPGAHVDLAWTGDTVWVLAACTSGTGGVLTIKDTSGNVVKTITTGGFPARLGGAAAFTGAFKLSGYGAGTHSVRLTLTSGSVTLAGLAIPNPTPPTVAWFQPGGLNFGAAKNTLIAAYITACAAVLGDFPTVVPVGTDANFDVTTMLASDNTHLNDMGNRYAADLIQNALAGTDFTAGLNTMTQAAASYTAPTPTYPVPAPVAAPAAPGTPAVSGVNPMSLLWQPSTDDASTITSQTVQSSTDGGTTWTVLTSGLASSAAAYTTPNLTPGSSYVFRVGATNSFGTTYSAASAPATAGSITIIYAADTFSRADSATVGSSETGTLPWTTPTSAWSIASGRLVSGVGPSDCYIDAGHADGTVAGTVTSAGGQNVNTGFVFRGAGTNNATAYIVYNNNAWVLAKRLNGTATTIATGTGVAAAGDVVSIVMSGSSITVKVNGVTVITTTDATYTGTRHGFTNINKSNSFDNFSHTSALS